MKRNLFTGLRFVTCGGLLALLLMRASQIPAHTFWLFLPLVLLWFVPTLGWRFTRIQLPHPQLAGDFLYTMVDTYLLLMTTAEAVSDSWHNPFLLLGGYVFLTSLLGGARVGGGSAGAGFFGLLNGWLLPADELRGATLLLGGGAALAGLACGTVWRLGVPWLRHAVAQVPTSEPTPNQPQDVLATQIAAMEGRLRDISAERDQAQERLSEWEALHPRLPAPPHPAHAAPNTPTAPTPAGEAELLIKLQQREAALASIKAEKSALLTEKQALMAEISGLTKELMAAYSASPTSDQPATTPTKDDAHAPG